MTINAKWLIPSILLGIILISCKECPTCKECPKVVESFGKMNFGIDTVSAPIEWREAKELIRLYNNPRNRIPNIKNETVSGFSLSSKDILDILKLEDGKTDVASIFMAFGYHKGNDTIPPGHTTIFLGMDKDSNLMINHDDVIIDYCDPCPKKCPKNVDLGSIKK